MFANTRKFVVENVLPSYTEYVDYYKLQSWGENQLLRKGINAAVSLFHLREHLPSSVTPTRKALEISCPDYGLVGDIANAAKHQEITKNNPQISSANQMHEVKIMTLFSDDLGEYWVSQLEIILILNNGTERKMTEVLYNVIKMWRDLLDQLNIIDLKEPELIDGDKLISRNEAMTRRSELQITRGEEYNWEFRFRRYNYQTKRFEPFDLTDHDITFRVRQLPKSIPMSVSLFDGKNNFDLDYDFPVTSDQARQYLGLTGDDERNEYLNLIVSNNPEIQEEIMKLLIEKIRANSRDS